jgi:hypothetical protein
LLNRHVNPVAGGTYTLNASAAIMMRRLLWPHKKKYIYNNECLGPPTALFGLGWSGPGDFAHLAGPEEFLFFWRVLLFSRVCCCLVAGIGLFPACCVDIVIGRWRGARAADRAALEMPCALTGTPGSNPGLSDRKAGIRARPPRSGPRV